ncbi:MAG: Wzz/FepE/Etk N-terminal domain-containing protein [Melioribacteraceae bacterium]|jgi:tyrosine-protein kinase Etk/Wzc|nr:Wzz/FepE/Etk N-terminal domain-containing protein [Melioribacteraceae bacterium]
MIKEKDLSDLVIIFIKWKKFLIFTTLLVGVLSYISIYVFIEEQFDSKALIIPSEDSGVSGLAGMLGDLSGLPMGLGNSNPDISLFTNIIYSRTMLEEIINKFDLISIYKIDVSREEYMELALETLSGSITAEENDFMAYEIAVRSSNPQLSADITNYIITRLNEKLIELNVRKSTENREFLGKRLTEVQLNMKLSEDSLKRYQERTGVFNAEEQIKGTFVLLTELETNLMLQETELSVYKKILSEHSPQITNSEIKVEEYRKRLNDLKSNDNGASFETAIPVKKMPEYIIEYYRLMREIEINNKMLQFILPLYEQARFEEQKEMPVLRVLDYGIPAAKKSYPPRSILTILIAFGIFIMLFTYVVFKESEEIQNSEKYNYIKANLFRWNNK